jgi:hypothetical protein
MPTGRKPFLKSTPVTLLMLAGAVSCAVGYGHRTDERPWAPADARVERLDDLRKPGIIEVGFWVSTVPEELVMAIRQHYAQERWRERTVPEAFTWHGWRGGGVLRVPGQPNPVTIGWCGEWVNGAGDIVFYSVQAESDKPSDHADVHVYASFRAREQYFEQCAGRSGNEGGR